MLTRPTLASFTAQAEELQESAQELFEVVLQGAIQVHIHQTLELANIQQAHQQLEARQTTGSTVLLLP